MLCGFVGAAFHVNLLSITALKQAAASGRVPAAVHVQIDTLARKATREGKPFYELTVADADGKMTLRAWSDSASFDHCEALCEGCFLEVAGEFFLGN